PVEMHHKMAATLDRAVADIRAAQHAARAANDPSAPRSPMIVLGSPKGGTGPKEVNGHKVEGSWRAHQVPLADVRENPASLAALERWMRSYQPEELFDPSGSTGPPVDALFPPGLRR